MISDYWDRKKKQMDREWERKKKQKDRALKEMRQEIDKVLVIPNLGPRPRFYGYEGFSQKIWDRKRRVLQLLYRKLYFPHLPSSRVNTRNEFERFVERQKQAVLDALALEFLHQAENETKTKEFNAWFQAKLDSWPLERNRKRPKSAMKK